MNKEIAIDIIRERKKFDRFFNKLLNNHLTKSYLDKAMLYSSLNGGKRVRPYLVTQFAKIKKIHHLNYYILATVIEIIHSYSLIHDDLPSMDNDDFRRGKPSTHKKFNEAQAILAGDSLHDLAFEVLSDKKNKIDFNISIQLINQLSKNLGSLGLAGGQSLDLIYENKNISINKIFKMYKMKTGALFKFCCTGPFIMSEASKKEINFASDYGEFFGLIFQIVDDYLDIVSTKKTIGKTPGKDYNQKKSTILNCLGNNNLKIFCREITVDFTKKNNYYLIKWPKLKELLYYLIDQL